MGQKNCKTAVSFSSETIGEGVLTWDELVSQTNSLVIKLKELGVQKGDRVVAILPNIPHSIVAFCATASVGAIWSLCAPDMGETAILDRFKQIKPKVLICQDGYIYAGKFISKVNALKTIIKKRDHFHAIRLDKRSFKIPANLSYKNQPGNFFIANHSVKDGTYKKLFSFIHYNNKIKLNSVCKYLTSEQNVVKILNKAKQCKTK